jgi:hypothetical protein
MRVRIVRRTAWETDGIQLSRFNVGDTYDIPPSLAIYLIASGRATAIEGADEKESIEQIAIRGLRYKIRESLVARKRAEKKR